MEPLPLDASPEEMAKAMEGLDEDVEGVMSAMSSTEASSQLKQAPVERSEEEEDDENDTFCKTVEEIICKLNHDKQSAPLSDKDLTKLSTLCSIQNHKSSFAAVQVDQLLTLMGDLESQVRAAISKSSLLDRAIELLLPKEKQQGMDKWLKKGHGFQHVCLLRQGLEAAAIAVCIAATPNLDRRCLQEDVMNAVLTLLKTHLTHNLIPALNQTGHLVMAATAVNKKKAASPVRKKRRSSSDGTAATSAATLRDLKKVYRCLLDTTLHWHLLLTERLERLVTMNVLTDQQLLTLTNCALQALELDKPFTNMTALEDGGGCMTPEQQAQQLQITSCTLVTAAFERFPQHRETLLQDLFPVMLRLPTGKRSLRTHLVPYHSVSSPTSLHAFNMQLLGHLLGGGDGSASSSGVNLRTTPTTASLPPHCIQPITALVLSLVQSGVSRPVLKRKKNKEGSPGTKQIYRTGLASSHAVADAFVQQLLQRVSAGKSSAAASEFRALLHSMAEDWLSLYLLPEFPAAQLLLLKLTQRLAYDLSKAANAKQSGSLPETTYLNSAFDLLGKTCAVQARILACSKQLPLELTPNVPLHNKSNQENVVVKNVKCYCGETDVNDGQHFLRCDSCHLWMHATCVGVITIEAEEEWHCDACRLGKTRQVERRHFRKEQREHGADVVLNEVYTLFHALLANLSHREGHLQELRHAINYHICVWLDGLQQQQSNDEALTKVVQTVSNKLLTHYWMDDTDDTKKKKRPSSQPLSDYGMNRLLLKHTANTSPLIRTFRQQIAFLVGLLGDSSCALRKLSTKAIEKAVAGDPTLMTLPIITRSVSARLADEAISVREAALSLVGTHVELSPQVARNYQEALLNCLQDVGLSVRKRTIKIYTQVLTTQQQHSGASKVCHLMLERAADRREEDGVRDLIHDLFTTLWLQNGQDIVVNGEDHVDDDEASADAAAGRSPIRRQKRTLKRADIAAQQMMEVVRAGGTNEHLETLLQKLVGKRMEETDKSGKKRQLRPGLLGGGAQIQCNLLVDSLFELLLRIGERNDRKNNMGKDLAATLQTIEAFCELSPETVLRHLDTLLPYLKGNGLTLELETAIGAATCDILSRLCRVVGTAAADPLSAQRDVSSDFYKICTTRGAVATEAAIRVWSQVIVNASEDTETSTFAASLLKLARAFYTYLYKKADVKDLSTGNAMVRHNAHRALTSLGFICQYLDTGVDSGAWEEELYDQNAGEEQEAPPTPDEMDWSNSMLACYRIFSIYLQKIDVPTKCATLRAFGCMFVAQPRLMMGLQTQGLIEQVMSDQVDATVRTTALQCWQKILEEEEKRVDGGRATEDMEADQGITVSKKISGDQDGDATLNCSVLTSHADRVLEMTQDPNAEIRSSALDLVEVLLRQGLANPNEAVPYLFSLQGDIENDPIRNKALQLLLIEGGRRPDLLRQRVCAGVKLSYSFQRTTYGDRAVSAIARKGKGENNECIFSHVYKQGIASNRKQRRGLFSSLLGLFELQEPDEEMAEEARKSRRRSFAGKPTEAGIDLDLLSFASQILAYLPYAHVADPLFIVYQINASVPLQGQTLLDRFAAVLRPAGLSSSDEFDEINTHEDDLERAAKNKFPSKTQEATALSDEKMDVREFTRLVSAGVAVVLLLRLKHFLRQLYNLSEARCLEFDPNLKERICDRGIHKMEVSKPFDSGVGDWSGGSKDWLIRNYAEFRRLMRQETAQQESREEEAQHVVDDFDDDDIDVFAQKDVIMPSESKKRRRSGSNKRVQVMLPVVSEEKMQANKRQRQRAAKMDDEEEEALDNMMQPDNKRPRRQSLNKLHEDADEAFLAEHRQARRNTASQSLAQLDKRPTRAKSAPAAPSRRGRSAKTEIPVDDDDESEDEQDDEAAWV